LIKLTSRGSFKKTQDWLRRMQSGKEFAGLDKYGAMGVNALKRATPVDSGATQEGWYYEIIRRPGYYSIQWLNSHTEEPGHIPIAVLIQFGHGTRNGGYVEGRDYINPAMRPIFDQIADAMWKEVTR
jgi:hypothetical protein